MPRRTHEKICQNCRKPFWGLADKYFCDDCSKKLRAERTSQEKICEDCGRSFIGGPKSFRCPDCQRKIDDRRKQANKYYGAERPLGSTDRCIVCGKEYVVEGGLQKYCSAKCRLIGLDSYNKRRKENIEQKKRKKAEMRANQLYVCQYCKRPFTPVVLSGMKLASHLYCSDYCRKGEKKIQLCIADIKRGKSRDLQKYIDDRNQYREKVAQEKASEN